MKKSLITTLVLALFPFLLAAQNHSISGKVHRHNFDPLPNFEFIATYNTDTSIVITNNDGEYILENIPQGSEVTFAYYNIYDVFDEVTILDRNIGRDWLLQIIHNSTDIQALRWRHGF